MDLSLALCLEHSRTSGRCCWVNGTSTLRGIGITLRPEGLLETLGRAEVTARPLGRLHYGAVTPKLSNPLPPRLLPLTGWLGVGDPNCFAISQRADQKRLPGAARQPPEPFLCLGEHPQGLFLWLPRGPAARQAHSHCENSAGGQHCSRSRSVASDGYLSSSLWAWGGRIIGGCETPAPSQGRGCSGMT